MVKRTTTHFQDKKNVDIISKQTLGMIHLKQNHPCEMEQLNYMHYGDFFN